MDCGNTADDTTKMVYFACCTSACDCVDPVVTSGDPTDIASTVATDSTTTAITATVASAVGVAVLGLAAVAVTRRANAEKEQQLHAVLAQDEISDL